MALRCTARAIGQGSNALLKGVSNPQDLSGPELYVAHFTRAQVCVRDTI